MINRDRLQALLAEATVDCYGEDANRPVTIYISAASDLMAEREALARMIAVLPVTLAWHIAQTPVTDADSFNLEALQVADLHLLIMGGDIRAPVGLEWRIVRHAHRLSAAFLKHGVLRTPAGQIFIKDTDVAWQPFADTPDLTRQVQRLLAEHLVSNAPRYALTPEEVAQLEALSVVETPAEQSEGARGKEAGHSAVVLSRERFEPSGGVVVGKSGQRPAETQ